MKSTFLFIVALCCFDDLYAGTLIKASASPCVDALNIGSMLPRNMDKDLDDSTEEFRFFIKWRDRAAEHRHHDTDFSESLTILKNQHLALDHLVPYCELGINELAERLSKEDSEIAKKLYEESFNNYLNAHSHFTPERIEQERKYWKNKFANYLKSAIAMLRFFSKMKFEEDWRQEIQPKTQKLVDGLNAWETTSEGRRTVEAATVLFCPPKMDCLTTKQVWIQGLEFETSNVIGTERIVFRYPFTNNLKWTAISVLSTGYRSDSKWYESIKTVTNSNDPKTLGWKRFASVYRDYKNYDQLLRWAFHCYLQVVAENAHHLAGLKQFVDYEQNDGNDPSLGGFLYIKLAEKLQKKEKATREDVETYIKAIEASNFSIPTDQFDKATEPINGGFGTYMKQMQDGLHIFGSSRPDRVQLLRPGDLVVEFDGRSMIRKEPLDLPKYYGGRVGETKKVVLIRDGKKMELTIKLIKKS